MRQVLLTIIVLAVPALVLGRWVLPVLVAVGAAAAAWVWLARSHYRGIGSSIVSAYADHRAQGREHTDALRRAVEIRAQRKQAAIRDAWVDSVLSATERGSADVTEVDDLRNVVRFICYDELKSPLDPTVMGAVMRGFDDAVSRYRLDRQA